ncbi:hypothetical protein DIPPA_06576 [Diplonema papillatum]|nr:hypothetical protein DIPPA_06576 [Diplonema papillatum]
MTFTVSSNPTWAGVGIRPASAVASMEGFDTYVVDTDHRSEIQDNLIATRNGKPSAGSTPGPVLEAFNVSNGIATVSFYRLLDTGEAQDVAITAGAEYDIAWATGPGSSFDGSWSKHTTRNFVPVTLSPSMTDSPSTALPGLVPTLAPGAGGYNSCYAFEALQIDVDNLIHIEFQTGLVGGELAIEVLVRFESENATWAAVGFRGSKSNDMIGLDIVAFDSTNTDTVRDYAIATKNGIPAPDFTQNVTCVNYQSISGRTQVVFQRLLDTGDAGDYVIPNGSLVNLAWAYGDGTLDTWTKHKYHGNPMIVPLDCPNGGPIPAEEPEEDDGESLLWIVVFLLVGLLAVAGGVGIYCMTKKKAETVSYANFIDVMHEEDTDTAQAGTGSYFQSMKSIEYPQHTGDGQFHQEHDHSYTSNRLSAQNMGVAQTHV